jgi:sporulation protein YlmC with PRC-barrel domain
MKRSTLAGSVATCICLGLAAPLLAAEPAATTAVNRSSPGEQNVSAIKPAAKCLSDLRAFDGQMGKDGYWLGATGYGYGYPMMGGFGYGGFGYGYGLPMGGNRPVEAGMGDHPSTARMADAGAEGGKVDRPAATAAGYHNMRPGYEIRILVASANILAKRGQQQACEDVLATTRDIYKVYVADMPGGRVPMADVPGWRKQQIATAKPVTDENTSLRSDQLIGIEVRDPKDEALGSVDDIVMSPTTGKIAYLVIARGGIFGIGESYVPIPWSDFKVTTSVSLLVLDANAGTMAAAPAVNYQEFATHGHFDQESQKVDAYWKTHLSNISTGSPKR